MKKSSPDLVFRDCEPGVDTMRSEVLSGLKASRKTLPCKYLYDRRGSMLFDRICELEEYYPTRTELAIMRENVAEMAEVLGCGCMLIELGSGSSVKTRLLLEELRAPAAYVPVDISGEHLRATAEDLFARYPDLEVLPVSADFTAQWEVPRPNREVERKVVYFPGSTIGNFVPTAAIDLLKNIAKIVGTGGGLLIGVDLAKERDVLELAYNDAEGVTAEFNLNLLRRLNRELDADFDLDNFRHLAFFNPQESRIEIHLLTRCDQTVQVGEEAINFRHAETIHTENSYKHSLDGFAKIAAQAGFAVEHVWTDDDNLFSVQYLTVGA